MWDSCRPCCFSNIAIDSCANSLGKMMSALHLQAETFRPFAKLNHGDSDGLLFLPIMGHEWHQECISNEPILVEKPLVFFFFFHRCQLIWHILWFLVSSGGMAHQLWPYQPEYQVPNYCDHCWSLGLLRGSTCLRLLFLPFGQYKDHSLWVIIQLIPDLPFFRCKLKLFVNCHPLGWQFKCFLGWFWMSSLLGPCAWSVLIETSTS